MQDHKVKRLRNAREYAREHSDQQMSPLDGFTAY